MKSLKEIQDELQIEVDNVTNSISKDIVNKMFLNYPSYQKCDDKLDGTKVVCIDNSNYKSLTKYKTYIIKKVERYRYPTDEDYHYQYMIINDQDTRNIYPTTNFVSLKEFRKQKINKIYETK